MILGAAYLSHQSKFESIELLIFFTASDPWERVISAATCCIIGISARLTPGEELLVDVMCEGIWVLLMAAWTARNADLIWGESGGKDAGIGRGLRESG